MSYIMFFSNTMVIHVPYMKLRFLPETKYTKYAMHDTGIPYKMLSLDSK